ncbi:transposase [Candidatus Bipolaricaulota bacterium]|nr:transposase [Candidatus Bipolaricaulota bacterium]
MPRGVCPHAKWQLCVVHAVRDTLVEVRKKGPEAQDLKRIYRRAHLKKALEVSLTLVGDVVPSVPHCCDRTW